MMLLISRCFSFLVTGSRIPVVFNTQTRLFGIVHHRGKLSVGRSPQEKNDVLFFRNVFESKLVQRTQIRNLVSRTRRPVSFGLANSLYRSCISVNEEKHVNVDVGKTTLARIKESANRADRQKLVKELETADLMSSLYAWPKLKSPMEGSPASLIDDIYDRKNTNVNKKAKIHAPVPQDLNLLIQVELAMRMKQDKLSKKTLFECAHASFKSQGQPLKFVTYFFSYLLENFEEIGLSPEEVAKTCFYVYVIGDAPEGLMAKIEQYLSTDIEKFDFNSLHIISMGFFRANKRITDYAVLDKFAESLLKGLGDYSMDGVVSLLKIFRHSGFAKHSFFEELARKLVDLDLKKAMSVNQIMHIAMAYGSLKLYHGKLLETVVSKTKELIQPHTVRGGKIRTKDVGRLVWALGMFNYSDKDLMRSHVIPVFRQSLSARGNKVFPESLVDVAMGMAYLGQYSDLILNEIFFAETAASLRDHPLLEKTSQLLYLHHSVKIEHQDYRGNVLSDSFLATLPGTVYGDLQRELTFRQGLKTSLQALAAVLGPDCVICHCILPHFHTADLEIHLDEQNQPIGLNPVSGSANGMPAVGGMLELNSEKVCKRVVIEVIGQNQCAGNCDVLLGNTRTKLRQLQALGYTTHVIMPQEAKGLDAMTATEREDFYKHLLRSKFGMELNERHNIPDV